MSGKFRVALLTEALVWDVEAESQEEAKTKALENDPYAQIYINSGEPYYIGVEKLLDAYDFVTQ
jgi:hypothetical protein